MTDIMKVGDTINAKETMSSLEIAELTGKQHSHVMRDIRNILEQGVAESNFGLGSYSDANGQNRPCYFLTKKGCLILASGYDALLRERIINRWEELELEKKQELPKLPQTFAEALRLAAEQAEQLEKQQARIEEMKPKEEFFDQVTDSKDACDMATVAKVLNMGIGRNKLFEILRDNKILQGNNQPMQRYVDSCWFRVIETQFTKPNGDICINFKTIVYQKGIEGIRKLLTSLGYKKAGN
jgi:Rha family phage regulatory protein